MQKKILAIQGSSLTRVNVETDTTLFLALEAQKRNYQIYYYEPQNLSFIDGKVTAKCFQLTFFGKTKKFYKIDKKLNFNLAKKGLNKRKEMNSSNKDETIYLKHIEDIVDRKTNRAQLLLEQFNKQGNLDFFSHAKEDFSYSGL